MKQAKTSNWYDSSLRCINCNSLILKPMSDGLYKCETCGEFTDTDEEFQFERIKHNKGRED